MNATTANSAVFSKDFDPTYANAVRKGPFARKDVIRLYVCLFLAITSASCVATWAITAAIKSDSSNYDLSLSTGGVTIIHKDSDGSMEVPAIAETPAKAIAKLITA